MRTHYWLWLVLVLGCGDSEADIDDPCDSHYDCAVKHSECIDIGDGILRCEKECVFDYECGEGATCAVVDVTDASGFCVRLCTTASDCATGNWACVPFSNIPYSYCELR